MSAVYGCHNRAPLRDTVEVQVGWHKVMRDMNTYAVTRHPDMAAIPQPMTKTCQYTHTDLGQVDARCAGCKHRVEKPTEAQA